MHWLLLTLTLAPVEYDCGGVWLPKQCDSYSESELQRFRQFPEAARSEREQFRADHAGISDELIDGVEAYCRDEWETSFRMRKQCIDGQMEAMEKSVRLTRRRHPDALQKAIDQCSVEWELPDYGTYHWQMVVRCVEGEIAAYREFNPSG